MAILSSITTGMFWGRDIGMGEENSIWQSKLYIKSTDKGFLKSFILYNLEDYSERQCLQIYQGMLLLFYS